MYQSDNFVLGCSWLVLFADKTPFRSVWFNSESRPEMKASHACLIPNRIPIALYSNSEPRWTTWWHMLHRIDSFIRFSASFRSAHCLHLIITVSIQLVTGEISLAKFSSEKIRSTLLLLGGRSIWPCCFRQESFKIAKSGDVHQSKNFPCCPLFCQIGFSTNKHQKAPQRLLQ